MIDDAFKETYMKLALTKSIFHPTKVIFDFCTKNNISIDQFAELTNLQVDTAIAILVGEHDYTEEVIEKFQRHLGNILINGSYFTWSEIKKRHEINVAKVGEELKGSPYEKYVPVNNKEETHRYFGTVFNPLNKPVEELPIIFGFNNGGTPGRLNGLLVSQDGVHLGGGISFSEAWMRIDLCIVSSTQDDTAYQQQKHNLFRQHYPDGYIMEFVSRADVTTHNQLRRAIQLLAEKSNNYEGPIMK